MKKKIIITIIISLVILIFCVGLGSINISPFEIISIIVSNITGGIHNGIDDSTASIIWELRLPRVMLAFLTGAALSIGGAVVQSVLKNPLASPYTLGVSSGASLGAAIVIATGLYIPFLKTYTLALAGLVAGLFTVYLSIMLASKLDKGIGSSTIVLTGMVFSLFMNGVLTLIGGLAGDKYTVIIHWQMGSFSGKGWGYVKVFLPVLIICSVIIMLKSTELDILTFGEEQAKAIGVETEKIKWLMLILTAILTGTAVSFCGVIGFIDIIAPHIVRKMYSGKHIIVIPMSALIGGVFMVVADLVARTATVPKELPISAVTALVGAPFFAYVYFKGRKTA